MPMRRYIILSGRSSSIDPTESPTSPVESMCVFQPTEGRQVIPSRESGNFDLAETETPSAEQTPNFQHSEDRYIIPPRRSEEVDPADPTLIFQPIDDRYTNLLKSHQPSPSSPEIHITQLAPSKGPPDPPTEVQVKTRSDTAEFVLRPSVTLSAPVFARQRFQPIGVRTLVRIPVDGLPPHEASLVILEAPTLFGDPNPVRFPDLRKYYPELSMTQVDYQVMRTRPDEVEQSSIGTYIMFKAWSGSSLPQNRHFKNSSVKGDAFIAKVVENVAIDWAGGESSGSMTREVWTHGVAGVMYYNMPPSSIGEWTSDPDGNFYFEQSKLVKDILGLRQIDHHDVVDLDVVDRTIKPVTPDRNELKSILKKESAKGGELVSIPPKSQQRVAFQAEHALPNPNDAFLDRISPCHEDRSQTENAPKSILEKDTGKGKERAISPTRTQNTGKFRAEHLLPNPNDAFLDPVSPRHQKKSMIESAPNSILKRDTGKGKERAISPTRTQNATNFRAKHLSPNPNDAFLDPVNARRVKRSPTEDTPKSIMKRDLGKGKERETSPTRNHIGANSQTEKSSPTPGKIRFSKGSALSTKDLDKQRQTLVDILLGNSQAEESSRIPENIRLNKGSVLPIRGCDKQKETWADTLFDRTNQDQPESSSNVRNQRQATQSVKSTEQEIIEKPTGAQSETQNEAQNKAETERAPKQSGVPDDSFENLVGSSNGTAARGKIRIWESQGFRQRRWQRTMKDEGLRAKEPETASTAEQTEKPAQAPNEAPIKKPPGSAHKKLRSVSGGGLMDPMDFARTINTNRRPIRTIEFRNRYDALASGMQNEISRPKKLRKKSTAEQTEAPSEAPIVRLPPLPKKPPERLPKKLTGEPSEEPSEELPSDPSTELPKKSDDGSDDSNGLFEGLCPSLSRGQKKKLRKRKMKEEGSWVQKECNRKTADNTHFVCGGGITPAVGSLDETLFAHRTSVS